MCGPRLLPFRAVNMAFVFVVNCLLVLSIWVVVVALASRRSCVHMRLRLVSIMLMCLCSSRLARLGLEEYLHRFGSRYGPRTLMIIYCLVVPVLWTILASYVRLGALLLQACALCPSMTFGETTMMCMGLPLRMQLHGQLLSVFSWLGR